MSCTSATACTAAGADYDSSDQNVTLVEAWNGTAWTIQSTPNPSDTTDSYLTSVSCTSASACTAAGTDYDSVGTRVSLVERWNGTSWQIQHTPNPAGASAIVLSGVSCTSASACTAVGTYYSSAHKYTVLVERWNGTSRQIQSTPTSAASGISVTGISCSSATACWSALR